MDWVLVSGNIEYAVVGVGQRERVEHTDSGTFASANNLTVVATYASARDSLLHLVRGFLSFALVDGVDGGIHVDVVLAELLLELGEEDALGDVAGQNHAGELAVGKSSKSKFLHAMSAKMCNGDIADVHACKSFGTAPSCWLYCPLQGCFEYKVRIIVEQTAKYKQRLRSAGIDVTPQKSLPLQNEPIDGPEATAAPPKRRRLTKGAIKQRNEDILAEPHNVIRASGQEPPTSMTSIATWVTNLKKSLPREKHAEVDNHIQSVQTILEGAKYTKAELQEMATRWGLPMSLTTAPKASPKNLQQLIAAVTYLAV
ncbi:unnamed protein product [Symbiodinium sp. CCMP2592]|nr:unnamed protein product [Symbiodinium sp. CCMP2592]